MKRAHLRRSPRRSSWKRRVALFGVCLALGACLFAFSGPAISYLSLFPDSGAPPVSVKATQNKQNRSLSTALGKLNAQTIRAYVERWNSSDKNLSLTARGAVYIDAQALARRHPAWLLARDVERGAVSPTSPQIARILSSSGTKNTLDALSLNSTVFPSAPKDAPTKPSVVIASTEGNKEAFAARQNRSLNRFFVQNAAREALRARDEEFLARRAVEEAALRAGRGVVSELDVPDLSPEEALELLNLRLELLRNLSRTPAERAATRDNIRAIEAKYAALLQRQTERQANRLRALKVDIPARLRQEGIGGIERETRLALQKQSAARQSLSAATRNQLQRDLESQGSLRLVLPPVISPSPRFTGFKTFPESHIAGDSADFFELGPRRDASLSPLESKSALSPGDRAQLAARLRQKARLESQRWARAVSTSLGAAWTTDRNAPDATPKALRLVFPDTRKEMD